MKITSIEFSKSADKDFQKLKKTNDYLYLKIKQLINDIRNDGALGNPEKLKYNLTGYSSRRITQEHRLVYKVEDKVLYILSCYKYYK